MSIVARCPSCGTRNRVPIAASGRPRCASCSADLPWLVDATDANFDAAVQGPGLILVDLWAEWCGPCRMVAPILERLALRYAGRLKVVKVDVESERATAARFVVQGIPTLLVFVDGRYVDSVVGARPEEELARLIDGHLVA